MPSGSNFDLSKPNEVSVVRLILASTGAGIRAALAGSSALFATGSTTGSDVGRCAEAGSGAVLFSFVAACAGCRGTPSHPGTTASAGSQVPVRTHSPVPLRTIVPLESTQYPLGDLIAACAL